MGREGAHVAVSATANDVLTIFYLLAADLSLGSLTTKLRVRAWYSTNDTAPATTFTFGLYPVTTAGAAGAWTPTIGTVVSGSTAAIASPAADATAHQEGADFTLPANGPYALGVVPTGTLAANATGRCWAQLQYRNV